MKAAVTFYLLIALLILFGACEAARHEAEDAFHRGDVEVHAGSPSCNRDIFVLLREDAALIFTVHIPSDGAYPVSITYAPTNAISAPHSPSFTILASANGHDQGAFSGPLLVSPQTIAKPSCAWLEHSQKMTLRQGLNTITLRLTSSSLKIDAIDVSGAIPLAGRGATVPYFEIEAEDAAYRGTLIGPNRTYTALPSEASGRKAVQLARSGDYVEFTLSQPANGMVVRYSVPDSSTGTGQWGLLDVLVDGVRATTLNVTSLYSWVYGAYPFSKNPSDGTPHHFYDDVRTLFSAPLAAGSKVRLQGTSSIVYTIDLADFYTVPEPYTQPAGFLSITDFGADPTGVKDSMNATNAAIASAKQKKMGVWIPKGTFAYLQGGMWTRPALIVVDSVTVRGAGPWYTVLTGERVGVFGSWAPNGSSNVELYDFAIFGQTRTRIDTNVDSGNGGAIGSSLIQNLWIEHTKVGMWYDGPFDGLLISGCTIRNTFADGINFHDGISNCVVEQCAIRNTGDDSLAMWPEHNSDDNNVFRFNTLSFPILANTIAIYGGTNNSATDNLVSETINFGAGLQVGNRFQSVPLGGTTTFARTTVTRCGSYGYPDTNLAYGAVWVFAGDSPMTTPVHFNDIEILDSNHEGILFYQDPISNVYFNNITIAGATYAMAEWVQGSATFTNVVATNLTQGGQLYCGSGFTILDGGGNAGWDDKHCN